MRARNQPSLSPWLPHCMNTIPSAISLSRRWPWKRKRAAAIRPSLSLPIRWSRAMRAFSPALHRHVTMLKIYPSPAHRNSSSLSFLLLSRKKSSLSTNAASLLRIGRCITMVRNAPVTTPCPPQTSPPRRQW